MTTHDEQSQRERRTIRRANGCVGVIVGAFVGLWVGLGLGWGAPLAVLFPGDTVILAIVICGYGGYRFGEPFIDRVVELWKSFR